MILFLPNTKKELGLGNMRRCLLLKEQLEKKNLKCNIYLEKKINLVKIKKIIISKKIKFVIIDDYRYKEKHRKILKKLNCKIIQINYFNDNDKHIDIFLNYLKKNKKKPKIINDINYSIISPYKKYNQKKEKLILIYFSKINQNFLKKILKEISKNFKNYKIVLNSKEILNQISKEKLNSNIFLKSNNKDINFYLNKAQILISGGGLLSLEATRYNVKNIVIYSNYFQKVNSFYLMKKNLIAFRLDYRTLKIIDFIKKIRILCKTKKVFNKVKKNSLSKASLTLTKLIAENL